MNNERCHTKVYSVRDGLNKEILGHVLHTYFGTGKAEGYDQNATFVSTDGIVTIRTENITRMKDELAVHYVGKITVEMSAYVSESTKLD